MASNRSEQGEGVGRAAGEPGEHAAVGERADLHRVGLHHGLAEADLAVAADGHAAVVADGEDRRGANLQSFDSYSVFMEAVAATPCSRRKDSQGPLSRMDARPSRGRNSSCQWPIAGFSLSCSHERTTCEKAGETPLPRSPELMNANDTGLLVVDAQEKLLDVDPAAERDHLEHPPAARCGRRCLACRPPRRNSIRTNSAPTVPELKERLGKIPDKLAFSACVCSAIFERGGPTAGIACWCAASKRTCA